MSSTYFYKDEEKSARKKPRKGCISLGIFHSQPRRSAPIPRKCFILCLDSRSVGAEVPISLLREREFTPQSLHRAEQLEVVMIMISVKSKQQSNREKPPEEGHCFTPQIRSKYSCRWMSKVDVKPISLPQDLWAHAFIKSAGIWNE